MAYLPAKLIGRGKRRQAAGIAEHRPSVLKPEPPPKPDPVAETLHEQSPPLGEPTPALPKPYKRFMVRRRRNPPVEDPAP